MKVLQNISVPEVLLIIFFIAAMLYLFFIGGKNSKKATAIKIKNKSQAQMVKKYNEVIEKYNDLLERSSDIIDKINNNDVAFKTEEDCALFEKKVKNFNYFILRIKTILGDMPDKIAKNKKIQFDSDCKDINIYLNQIKTTIIEIGTILKNDSINPETEQATVLKEFNDIFGASQINNLNKGE